MNTCGNINTLNLLLSREELKKHTEALSTDKHPFSFRKEMIDPLYADMTLTERQREHLQAFHADSSNTRFPMAAQKLIERRIKRILDGTPLSDGRRGDTDAIFFAGPSCGGKTSAGFKTAAALGVPFVDGDTLHSTEAVRKMHADIPLTDEDRGPWMRRITAVGTALRHDGPPPVIVCSALTCELRQRLRAVGNVLFIDLWAPLDVLQERASKREHEYIRKEHSRRFIKNQHRLHGEHFDENASSDTLSIDTSADAKDVSDALRSWLNDRMNLRGTEAELPTAE